MVASPSLDEMYSLRTLFEDTFAAPVLAAWAEIDEITSLKIHLSEANAARMEAIARSGLANLAKLRSHPSVPASFGKALHALRASENDMMHDVRHQCSELTRIASVIRDLELPEGAAAGFLKGVIETNNPWTEASMGATAGATIGNMMLPGLGAAVGGVVGAIVGSHQTNKRNETHLDRYFQAHIDVRSAVARMQDDAWDLVVEMSGLPIVRSAYFTGAVEAWQAINDVLVQDDLATSKVDQVRASMDAFIEEWGPMKEALFARVRFALMNQEPIDDWLRGLSATASDLYPNDPEILENQIDVELAAGSFKQAADKAARASQLFPDHLGIRMSWVQALAALGDEGRLRAVGHRLESEAPVELHWHTLLGFLRAGSVERAGVACEQLRQEVDDVDVFLGILEREPLCAPLFSQGLVNRPDLEARCRAVVKFNLLEDGERRFYRPSSHLTAIARKEFVQVRKASQIIYFIDWSLWQSGKIGLALTTTTIQWKALWESPVYHMFNRMRESDVGVDGSRITVRDDSVDLEDEQLARALVTTIHEIMRIHHNSG